MCRRTKEWKPLKNYFYLKLKLIYLFRTYGAVSISIRVGNAVSMHVIHGKMSFLKPASSNFIILCYLYPISEGVHIRNMHAIFLCETCRHLQPTLLAKYYALVAKTVWNGITLSWAHIHLACFLLYLAFTQQKRPQYKNVFAHLSEWNWVSNINKDFGWLLTHVSLVAYYILILTPNTIALKYKDFPSFSPLPYADLMKHALYFKTIPLFKKVKLKYV